MKSKINTMVKNISKGICSLFCFCLFFSPFIVFSQDSTGGEAENGETLLLEEDTSGSSDEDSSDEESEEEDTRTLIEKTIAKDINTATYYELALWCSQLGLDDAGDLNKLKTRLFDFYNVSPEERQEGEKTDVKKKIEIKSAKRSEYFTIEEVDENYLLLEGDVLIEVFDFEDNVQHQIKAHRVILNQTENVLTAEKDIEYILTRSEGKPEKFTGESFSFDIDSWEGVFYRSRGETEKEIEEGKTSNFVYMGETISRLSNDTIILEKGTITSDQSPDNPYWMIKASKIWVLAPGEWAIRDLVLYVGKVPIFYFPFFFYPGDELFFHPVIGYRDREGQFVQTTTYLLGEKEDKKSPFSFLRIAEDDSRKYKKEIKGLFLRTTDKKKDETKPINWYLKVMLDVYSRLGGFLGLEGNFPDTFSIKGGIALSRNIYFDNGTKNYTPYDENQEDHWNSTSIFGTSVPFRYAIDTTFRFSLMPISFSGQIELFSDPYFPINFYEREETFNIAELIGMEEIEETLPVLPQLQQTLHWSASAGGDFGQYLPAPYFQVFSATVDFDMDWQSKEVVPTPPPESTPTPSEPTPTPLEPTPTPRTEITDDPSSQFYYPVKMSVPRVRLFINGNILTIPRSAQVTPSPGVQETPQTGDKPVQVYGMGFRPPYEFDQEEEESPESGTGSREEEEEEEEETGGLPEFKEPPIKGDADSIQLRDKSTSFMLNYSLSPEMLIEHQFYKEGLYSLEDVDFAPEYTQFWGLLPASLSYELGIWGGFLKFNGVFSINNQYQDRFNESEELSEETIDSYELTDYQNTGIRISKTFTTTLYPLLDVPVFSKSFLQHNVFWTFYRYKFEEMIGDEPSFISDLFLWDQEGINDRHWAKANIICVPWEKPYTCYFETDLPPDLYKIYSYLEYYIWLFKTRVSVWVNEVDPELDLSTLDEETRKKYEDGWHWINPIAITESIAFENILSFTQDLRYDWETVQWKDTTSNLALFKLKPADPFILRQTLVYSLEEDKVTKSESTLDLWGLQVKLLAQDMLPSYWDGDSWENEDTEEQLLLNSLDVIYTFNPAELYFWKYRVKWAPSIQSNFKYDFERFTESVLNFKLDMTFSIAEFLDLSFSSVSYNKSIYRYIPGIQDIEGFETVEYINPLYDLIRSFNFFNKEDRRKSGFKLDSLSISLVHHLYDWDLTFTYTGQFIEDINDEDKKVKRWNPIYSIFIQWKPIPEIKKEITGDADVINIGVD